MRGSTFVVAAGLVLGLGGVASAGVESLDGVNLGEHWYGPKRTVDDLQGRVVLLELWGFN